MKDGRAGPSEKHARPPARKSACWRLQQAAPSAAGEEHSATRRSSRRALHLAAGRAAAAVGPGVEVELWDSSGPALVVLLHNEPILRRLSWAGLISCWDCCSRGTSCAPRNGCCAAYLARHGGQLGAGGWLPRGWVPGRGMACCAVCCASALHPPGPASAPCWVLRPLLGRLALPSPGRECQALPRSCPWAGRTWRAAACGTHAIKRRAQHTDAAAAHCRMTYDICRTWTSICGTQTAAVSTSYQARPHHNSRTSAHQHTTPAGPQPIQNLPTPALT